MYKFKSSPRPIRQRDRLVATASLDFPSIAAAASATLTVSVPGAKVGDAASVHFPAAGPNAGVLYHAWVSAAGTVTVRATNITAAAVDPAAASLTVVVWSL